MLCKLVLSTGASHLSCVKCAACLSTLASFSLVSLPFVTEVLPNSEHVKVEEKLYLLHYTTEIKLFFYLDGNSFESELSSWKGNK
jgi:hypothetical protein